MKHPIDAILERHFPFEISELILAYEPCILEYSVVDEVCWSKFLKSSSPIPEGVIRCVHENFCVIENLHHSDLFDLWKFEPLEVKFERLFEFRSQDMAEEPFDKPCVLQTHLYPWVLHDALHYAVVEFEWNNGQPRKDAFKGVHKHLAENLLFFRESHDTSGDAVQSILRKSQKKWDQDENQKVYLIPGSTCEKIIKSIARTACFQWDGQVAVKTESLFIRQRFCYVTPYYPWMLDIVSAFFDEKSRHGWAHQGCSRPFMLIK